MTVPEDSASPPRPRPIGRRRRRARRTAIVIAAAAVLGAVLTVVLLRTDRPDTYRTGEEHAEITRTLDVRLPEAAPAAAFVDVTQEAGLGGFVTFAGARSSQLPEDMGAGAAWGDYDDDGDDDLFVVSAGGALTADPESWAPCRLYENLGGGRFRVSDRFPETRIVGMAAAWGDYDGDGAEDLALTGYNVLRVYRNGVEGFRPTNAIPALDGFWAGASWADFDLDGDLDLYVCGYVEYEPNADAERTATPQYGEAVPYTLNPASFPPAANVLFRNDGRGGFDEVAEELGVANSEGRSLSALWRDFDGDGWLDLYVANDISDNVLYRNNGGNFDDVSHPAWVADYRGAMGLAAGDWDRDGDDDLFVTHWIAQENALYSSLVNDLPTDAQEPGTSAGQGADPPASPAGGLRFMDVADMRGLGQIALQHIGWGAGFADFDRDGWLDLAVANGSTFETPDAPKRLRPEADFLFWNGAGNYYHNIGAASDAFATAHVTRGLALADHDLDGDVDILMVDRSGGVRLLRNDMRSGNWLTVRLRSHKPPSPRPVGARATLSAGGLTLADAVGDASYLSQHAAGLHFGLGAAEQVDRVTVAWRPGSVDEYSDLKANAIWLMTEGDPVARMLEPDAPQAAAPSDASDRQRVLEFWRLQRAAMDAMKAERELSKAAGLFRRALALNPTHEDSIYYLANCLAATGDAPGALEQLQTLRQIDPRSHRAHKRWAVLRGRTASNASDIAAAADALESALDINREETGVLTVLGEIDLLRGRADSARERFELVTRSNPRAVHGMFLLAYTSWRAGDRSDAQELLARAAQARGAEEIPKGAVSEGDVRSLMHSDATLLSRFVDEWDGASDPARAFEALTAYLERTSFR